MRKKDGFWQFIHVAKGEVSICLRYFIRTTTRNPPKKGTQFRTSDWRRRRCTKLLEIWGRASATICPVNKRVVGFSTGFFAFKVRKDQAYPFLFLFMCTSTIGLRSGDLRPWNPAQVRDRSLRLLSQILWSFRTCTDFLIEPESYSFRIMSIIPLNKKALSFHSGRLIRLTSFVVVNGSYWERDGRLESD